MDAARRAVSRYAAERPAAVATPLKSCDLLSPVLAHPAIQSRQSADAAVIAAARFMDRLGLEFRA